MSDYQQLFRAFERYGVQYVVVGGLAVVLHGYIRTTVDLDLIVDLAPAEARKAVAALASAGYLPSAPVDPEGFADLQTRAAWIAEKGITVFSWFHREDPLRVVDLFVIEPIPFTELRERATIAAYRRTRVPVASIADLIALKRAAGRAQDFEDISRLEEIERIEAERRG